MKEKEIMFFLTSGEAFNVASYIGSAKARMVEYKNTQCKTDKEHELMQNIIDTATKLEWRFENHR